MSWYKIGVITKRNGDKKRTKLDASRNRLFRISAMSCACLLMNTAATTYVSVVLEDWSVSSELWLTCTISETIFTRNWSNYGMNVESRFFLFL
jgi:hypothetical protein